NAQATKAADTDVYARVRLILAGEADDLVDDDLTDKINESPVYVDAFGLTAGLQGQLLVVDKPGAPTQGSGELQIIDGTYQAYGQNLTIEKGSILFPGRPITAPGLEVTAVRGDLEHRNVRVGVNVWGSLKQPKFELFSDPSMTQQEQLSYLVLGHALGASSGGESSLLAQAALALGLKGGNFLAQNLGSKLGLDEVGIESDSDQGEGEQASLVIGKYLSPRLYVSYGIGLLNSISILRVQYTITKNLQLVTESRGANSSGDVIYTIERGK
ncbi:MAG TPA: translocation/assembly module TamB domain-containing protein, partial [Gammaproteobacteria bacterium]|nr:translocation/assembly module TamB domain-containing protein [Gammaproteobacteria bacterium]